MIEVIVVALRIFCEVLSYVILARCIMSWLPLRQDNPIVKLVYGLTEPILGPIRRMLAKSPLGGGLPIDFSPIIAYFFIELGYRVVISVLMRFM